MNAPPTAPTAFQILAERERDFRAPEALLPPLQKVRRFLRDELDETPVQEMTLARAGLFLAAAGDENLNGERWVPLAAGVEMIYHALTVQQTALHPHEGADLFGILSQDLVLARALDLYATDGNPRVMEAVSRGAARLCEAFMAERAGESKETVIRCLGDFHVECAGMGAASRGRGDEQERNAADRVREAFHLSFGSGKESSAPASKKPETHPKLLEELLLQWP